MSQERLPIFPKNKNLPIPHNSINKKLLSNVARKIADFPQKNPSHSSQRHNSLLCFGSHQTKKKQHVVVVSQKSATISRWRFVVIPVAAPPRLLLRKSVLWEMGWFRQRPPTPTPPRRTKWTGSPPTAIMQVLPFLTVEALLPCWD